MDQEVKYINIEDLVLWTENPRDPINANASDQNIADRAFDDTLNKWTLKKLAKEMGDYYDFSELPTVVYHGKKPVVYDGNRRIILGKIKFNLVSSPNGAEITIPEFPKKIPCNVCTKKIALNNVLRKHSETGSWLPLERDIFLNKFMNKGKSIFLILEEETGIIRDNPHLNQRFVKDEIFKEENLKAMGFIIKDRRLYSLHNNQEGHKILTDISNKIENKRITTRKNRGRVIEVLEPSSQELIENNKSNRLHISKIKFDKNKDVTPKKQLTRRVRKKKKEIFGGKLYLQIGDVSNLYRDIDDLYLFYKKEKNKLSDLFPSIIRMTLRLLCETAANDTNKRIKNYVKENYSKAKVTLSKDTRTTLANQNVNEQSIIQLLHTGAHSYDSSNNIEQTLAISIIVGAMITLTHGKDE